jgi:hypothetical protein
VLALSLLLLLPWVGTIAVVVARRCVDDGAPAG